MTRLNKYYDMTNAGDLYPTYTRDSWEIPEAGTEIWCTGWSRGQTIKPAGDGCHVVVGFSVYHCDQLIFWTGPRQGKRKLILHWLPPIPVGVDDSEGPAVIHKVERGE